MLQKAVMPNSAHEGQKPPEGANGGRAGGSAAGLWTRALPPLPLQAKLTVNQPGDIYEQEADRVAAQVMRMPDPAAGVVRRCACGGVADATGECPACRAKRLGLQRKSDASGGVAAPPSVHETLRAPGRPLDGGARAFMESRFGHDFGGVRVHTGSGAAASARAVGAQAYTVGQNVVFGEGRYAPGTDEGKRLIAHELAHTVQQGTVASHVQRNHYTQQEREDMAQGRVVGQQNDVSMASQRHFQPGDIVFRLGSTGLGFLTGEEVTHGGIYIGNGLIHDVVGFGNRHVRVSNFFDPALGEAADSTTYRLVRFRGPLRDLIVSRLLDNISRRDFNMPTDSVPFNLFSSADDYRTATCLEYAHAQFLYAIRRLATDQTVSDADRGLLRSTYFAPGATNPNALIQPREQRLIGGMASPTPSSGIGGPAGGLQQPSASALMQEAMLMAAASALASDVDPSRFSNRSESRYAQHWPGGSGIGGTILNLLLGPTHDEVVLRTFTYRSFVDSRQFFEDVT